MEDTNNTKTGLSQILESVKGVIPKHCDICGTRYEEYSFSLVKEDPQHKIVHIRCHECGNTYILNVMTPHQGVLGSSRAQVNLDLSNATELVKFAATNPISTNDALDAYNIFNRPNSYMLEWVKGKSNEQAQDRLTAL